MLPKFGSTKILLRNVYIKERLVASDPPTILLRNVYIKERLIASDLPIILLPRASGFLDERSGS